MLTCSLFQFSQTPSGKSLTDRSSRPIAWCTVSFLSLFYLPFLYPCFTFSLTLAFYPCKANAPCLPGQRFSFWVRSISRHHNIRPSSATAADGFSAHKQWDALSKIGDLIKPQSTNRKDFIEECKSGRLDGVVAAFRTFPSVSITGLFDEELVNSLPKSWRFLAQNGMLWFAASDFEEEGAD
jgi:hypothetical protein